MISSAADDSGADMDLESACLDSLCSDTHFTNFSYLTYQRDIVEMFKAAVHCFSNANTFTTAHLYRLTTQWSKEKHVEYNAGDLFVYTMEGYEFDNGTIRACMKPHSCSCCCCALFIFRYVCVCLRL